jgi:hypothetical protein
MVEMSNHLVETLVRTKNCDAQIKRIIASNDQTKYYGLYAKLWLQSKYGSPAELLQTLLQTEQFWVPHERLGRLAASFLPLFHSTPEHSTFRSLLDRTLNPGVRQTYKFHVTLSESAATFSSMFDALKAPNPSRGTGITHSKFLCLLSALRNTAVPPAQIKTLRTNNALAFKDAYYRSIAKRSKII